MNKTTWLIALGVCLFLATLSPLASSLPDGLEKAGVKALPGMGGSMPVAILAGYLFPGIENEALATILAGWLGTLLVFTLAYGITYFLYRLRKVRARP